MHVAIWFWHRAVRPMAIFNPTLFFTSWCGMVGYIDFVKTEAGQQGKAWVCGGRESEEARSHGRRIPPKQGLYWGNHRPRGNFLNAGEFSCLCLRKMITLAVHLRWRGRLHELRLEAEFRGSKREVWGGHNIRLSFEFQVDGTDNLSLMFKFRLENLSVCVGGSIFQCM